MSFLHRVLKSESPSYLFNTIPNSNRQRQTRNSGNIPPLFVKHYFFLSAVTNWNKLDCYISNVDSFEVFKKRVLSFIRPMPNSIYNIHNPLGVKYLTRLRIVCSHLKEHKFKHNFQNSIDKCAAAVVVLKQGFIFIYIAQILILKDKPSLAK